MRLTIDKRGSILRQETNNKFYDKVGGIKKQLLGLVEDEVKKISPKIPENLEGYINTSNYFKLEGSEECPIDSLDNYYPRKGHQRLTIKVTPKIKTKLKQYYRLEEEEIHFRKELRAVLYGFSCAKKLCKAIPEFEKYFENEIASNALVPVEQINSVRKRLAK